jgi:hypothetical protein
MGISVGISMGFNRRKMEDERRRAADKKTAEQRATNPQILEDAARLVAVWNERQARGMPMLFSPTIGAAIAAGYWFLWVRCPACRTTNAIDLRTLDRHHDRPAHARPPPRCGDHQSYSGAVVPVLPAERAVRRIGAAVAQKHRRRIARVAPRPRAARISSRGIRKWPRNVPGPSRTRGERGRNSGPHRG